jgi:DNA (cytosine-5)-methyltransferase 1
MQRRSLRVSALKNSTPLLDPAPCRAEHKYPTSTNHASRRGSPISAHQEKHPFDFKTQYGLGFSTQDDEIVVDFFCGGGDAGLEMGLGRAVNVAKNHTPQAISMHTVNHPGAVHYTTDVFEGVPDTECGGKAVGWFHMSPDCTHHSQAAGGQPRKREIRNLLWIGLKWAGKKKPRVISLENVKQILQWGPLIAKRCKTTGRVMKLGGSIAEPGEVLPAHQQFLVPDPKRRGQTWAVFVAELQKLGYVVEWRVIKACDFGAPTSRERLFMIARCDGQPIVWPEPTHAKHPGKGQQKWRTAAECIDWTIPSKRIFDRAKPLTPATLRRIAKGMKKFVIDAADPFIVPIANWSGESVQSADEPLRTVTSWPRGGSFAMASPIIAPATHQGSNRINDPHSPLPTVTCANRGELTLISPVLVGAGGPVYAGNPVAADKPLGTLMTRGHRALAAAHLVKFRFSDEGKALDEPLPTITSGGNCQRTAGAAQAMGISTVFMAQMNGGFNTTAAKSIKDADGDNHRQPAATGDGELSAPARQLRRTGRSRSVAHHQRRRHSPWTGHRIHGTPVRRQRWPRCGRTSADHHCRRWREEFAGRATALARG